MPIASTVNYQQILSMALEDRSRGFQDLVSTDNALLTILKRKNAWKTYSGPRIRVTLQIDKADVQWYNGFDYLDAPPIELFNDAYFTPKMMAVPVALPMEEILNNAGHSQILDTMDSYMTAAEGAAKDGMDLALHGDGTADGGKQLTGLRATLPTVTNTGTYGGIDRSVAANALWRTYTYDANSDFSTIGTQVNSTTIRPMLNSIMTRRARGRKAPDLLLMSPEHYAAYDAATIAIQRINDVNSLGSLGFSSFKYYGGGRQAEIVQDGGDGTNMPANTTYLINTDDLEIRYNPQRNFSKLFEGDGQHPINQDAIVQYLGWMGELILKNPLFSAKFYDSNPSA
mgnify:CR=1 FL=1